jgi:adenylosuccinate lyase
MWTYISMGYFEQKVRETEVGSSTMPHKVNPIDFENAEGNLGIANAIFEHLSAKLPVSRLQRDLTDSTVVRNIGVPMAHTLIAIKSIEKGMNKLTVNENIIIRDLRNNWAVITEGIQTILRREKYHEPYEKIMLLVRNHKKITRKILADFIETLDVSHHVKNELLNITPETYTGIYDF